MYFSNVDAFVALDIFPAAYLSTVLSFNEETDAVFTAGQVPIVEMGTAGTFVVSIFNRFSITGDLEDAP